MYDTRTNHTDSLCGYHASWYALTILNYLDS
jgi:hypothetical protein